MKNHLNPTFALAICALLCDGYTTYYGPNGQYAGASNTLGNSTTFYDQSGGYAGNAYTTPNGTTFYGPSGQFNGYTNSTGGFEE